MKIIFITHETSRTGAPIVLLHFLRWLNSYKPEIELSVLSLKEGSLNQEFVSTCNFFYDYNKITKPDKLNYRQRILVKLKLKKTHNKRSLLFKRLQKEKFDVVYTNTIKAIPFGSIIKSNSPEIKHIAHIHELNVIIKQLLPDFKNYINGIDEIIVPSDLVKHNLSTYWDIPEARINRVYSFSKMNVNFLKTKKKDTTFLVGGSGTVHWRKGYDLFIQVARYVKTNYPDKKIHFTWVGKLHELEKLIIEEDLRKLNLSDIVSFVGELENPTILYNDFDVFLMTSREDPFPLVCIEVGLLGKPIISFEQATGINEILIKGGGYIMPYLNIEAMAESVIHYFENPIERLEHGKINTDEFSKFTADVICPELFSVIKKQILNH